MKWINVLFITIISVAISNGGENLEKIIDKIIEEKLDLEDRSFEYDTTSDYYNSNDWRAEVTEIKSITDLLHVKGTHTDTMHKIFERYYMYFTTDIATKTRDVSNDLMNKFDQYLLSNYNQLETRYAYIITVYNSSNDIVASGYLLKSPDGIENPWDRVFIFADGFDTGNLKTIFMMASPRYKEILIPSAFGAVLLNAQLPNDNSSTLAASTVALLENPYSELFRWEAAAAKNSQTVLMAGFDLCWVDFAIGDDDIRVNAKAMLKIIEEVCKRAKSTPSNGLLGKTTPYDVVVGGWSMGGIVSRLALLYAQRQYNGKSCAVIPNVKRYISVDSPHKGSTGFPPKLQKLGVAIAPEQKASLESPASIQMMDTNIVAAGADKTAENKKFYQFLKDIGDFPKGMKLISIANANSDPINNGQPYDWGIVMSFKGPKGKKISSDAYTVTFSGNAILPGSAWPILGDQLDKISRVANEYLLYVDAAGISTMALTWNIFDAILPPPWNIIIRNLYIGAITAPLKFTRPGISPTFMPIRSVWALNDDIDTSLIKVRLKNILVDAEMTPFDHLDNTNERHTHIDWDEELVPILVKWLLYPQQMPSSITFSDRKTIGY